MSTFPTVTHKVDFAHDPASASFAAATDLSTRVLSFSCTRGRAYETATIDAGTATYDWQDTDGALDPTNTSSAHYPNVLPYRAVQTKATWNAVTYNIYTGLVERWPMSWDHEFGTVASQCTDIFAILANKILSIGYQHETLTDSPVDYYPLNDTGGTTAANRMGGGVLTGAQTIYAGGNLTFGATSITSGETSATSLGMNTDLTSASGDDFKGYYFTGPSIASLSSTYTFEAWVNIDANFLAAVARGTSVLGTALPIPLVTVVNSAGDVIGGICLFDLSGSLVFGWLTTNNNPQFTVTYPVSHPTLTADTNYHIAFVNDGAGNSYMYVNGTQYVAASPWGSIAAGSLAVGGYTPATYYFYSTCPNYRGRVENVAVYSTALSSSRIAAHYNIGATGFAGDTADARISRILGYAGYAGTTSFDSCTTTMLSINPIDGQTALAAIQDVERAEGGTFYVGKDGTLTYKSRTTRLLTTASSYTFGDGAGELPYDEVTFDFDPTFIYNDIQLQRDGGAAVYVSDATSQGHYGLRTYNKTLNIQSDGEATDAANWILRNYKDPRLRVASITLDPAANSALFPACLNVDIGTRVTVKRRPIVAGNVISSDFFVEQITHHVTPRSWVTQLALSPVPPVQALIWDDTTAGKWDTDVWAW